MEVEGGKACAASFRRTRGLMTGGRAKLRGRRWVPAHGRCAALAGMTSLTLSSVLRRRSCVFCLWLILTPGAQGRAECRADALGTSRVLAVDPTATPRVGRKRFPAQLPLGTRAL